MGCDKFDNEIRNVFEGSWSFVSKKKKNKKRKKKLLPSVVGHKPSENKHFFTYLFVKKSSRNTNP